VLLRQKRLCRGAVKGSYPRLLLASMWKMQEIADRLWSARRRSRGRSDPSGLSFRQGGLAMLQPPFGRPPISPPFWRHRFRAGRAREACAAGPFRYYGAGFRGLLAFRCRLAGMGVGRDEWRRHAEEKG